MKKEQKTSETSGFYSLEEDFIPYATHIDERTLITKNLQILQTIKINNFLNKELHHDKQHITLREFLRQAIKKNIKSENFAFWIHTLRRRVDLHELLNYDEPFSKDLNDKWNAFNKFETQFINELYVTIIAKGPEIKDKEVALKYFTNSRLKSFVMDKLESVSLELTSVVDGILKDLEEYSPACLQIKEKDGISYSENMEFLNKILNLADVRMELDEADISSSLAISQIELFPNKINIKNDFTSKSVGVLTLKHYLETNPEILDNILVLPFEFIIYQAFDFVNFADVMDKYYTQYKMLKISKDETMMRQLNFDEHSFDDIEKRQNDATLDYGESQISIIVIADDEDSLDKEMSAIVSALQETGFVFVRDDIMIEDSFFACLPANFFFLRRMQPMQTAKIGGFASIDNHPIGRINKNPWGDAVCLFKSSDGYPFFFNFHDDSKCGHTIFFGKINDLQRNAISNFLITHSRKFEARIISFDKGESTKICNAFLGGKYKTLSSDDRQNTLKFNPVKLLAEPDYFKKFIEICLQLNGTKLENLKAYINEKLMPFIVSNQQKFSNFHELLNFINNEKITNQFFTETSQNGVFYSIFGGKDDDIISLKSDEFLSMNLYTLFVEEAWVAKFFFEYFRIAILQLTQDKKRTIIKMDSFFEICEICEISKEEIIVFLKALKENNVVFISLENYVFFENYQESEKDVEILDLFSTQIYNPAFASYGGNENNISNNYLKQISRFSKLTEHEMDVVSKFAFDDEVFVVKHSDKLVALEFKYDFSNLYYFIFSGKEIDDGYLKSLVSASSLEGKLEEANNIYRQFFTET